MCYNRHMENKLQKIDGRYLKELRTSHGLSIRDLAEKIYVSKSSVQRWEKSFVPENADIINELADIFGLSVAEMRAQSAKRYGGAPEEFDDGLTPDQRAEAKFGLKGIGRAVLIICAVAAVAIFVPLIFLIAGIL